MITLPRAKSPAHEPARPPHLRPVLRSTVPDLEAIRIDGTTYLVRPGTADALRAQFRQAAREAARFGL